MDAQLQDYGLENAIYNLVIDRPEWATYLRNMVRWEELHPGTMPYDIGWVWQDVSTPISVINQLIIAQVVEMKSKSRSYTHYRLKSVEATKHALENLDIMPVQDESIDVDSLFSLVVGQERVKQLMRFALKADQPVHCLLIGPPGCAKSLMLSDIARLPGAEMYVGSTTTRAGLIALLLGAKPRYLILDEIDKMKDEDRAPLLNLMETGLVTRLQHGVQNRVQMETKVFAGANDVRKISDPILSRFAKFELPPYTPREFVDVAKQVLIQREGLGPEMAQLIATEVVQYSLDIRDAVRVARMTGKNPFVVKMIVDCLWGKSKCR